MASGIPDPDPVPLIINQVDVIEETCKWVGKVLIFLFFDSVIDVWDFHGLAVTGVSQNLNPHKEFFTFDTTNKIFLRERGKTWTHSRKSKKKPRVDLTDVADSKYLQIFELRKCLMPWTGDTK